jgi:hypothetical protein
LDTPLTIVASLQVREFFSPPLEEEEEKGRQL